MKQVLLNTIHGVLDKAEINNRIEACARYFEGIVKSDADEIGRLCRHLVDSENPAAAIVEAYATVISDIAMNMKDKLGIGATDKTTQDAKKD